MAVIGGAGRMGKWLVGYFLRQGHEVFLSDNRRREARAVAKSTGAELAWCNIEAIKDADLAVFSTPIEVTPHALKKMAPQLRHLLAVMEISSLKFHVVPVLHECAECPVKG